MIGVIEVRTNLTAEPALGYLVFGLPIKSNSSTHLRFGDEGTGIGTIMRTSAMYRFGGHSLIRYSRLVP
jgi:hypothetical protein